MLDWLYFVVLVIVCFVVCFVYVTPGYKLVQYLNKIYSYEKSDKVFYNTGYEWCKMLRRNYKKIRREYFDYKKSNKLKSFREVDNNQIDYDISDIPWPVLFLRVYNRDTDKVSYFPRTCKLLRDIPGCTLAMFSVLPPGKVIPPHVGPFSGVLRYHLCLVDGGEGCFINVGGKKYIWKSGKDVIFDDTFEHFVENNSDKTRVILFIDIQKRFSNPILDIVNTLFLKLSQYNKTVYDIVYNTNHS